jgi:hypothetical protein
MEVAEGRVKGEGRKGRVEEVEKSCDLTRHLVCQAERRAERRAEKEAEREAETRSRASADARCVRDV